jgi:hypothetical protein
VRREVGLVSAAPTFAPDAALVLGIAATAIPFARTPEDQAERWLRVLRLHGEVGAALQALGVSEDSMLASQPPEQASAEGLHSAAVTNIAAEAVKIAALRGSPGVATTDVLLAVMRVYGPHFDHVLRAHGTDRDEVLARLGLAMPRADDPTS